MTGEPKVILEGRVASWVLLVGVIVNGAIVERCRLDVCEEVESNRRGVDLADGVEVERVRRVVGVDG